MINYGGRIGVYGDYSHYTSKPLHDFIYESNKGHDVFLLQPRMKRQNAAQRMKKHDVGENLIAILSHMVSAAYDSDARSD